MMNKKYLFIHPTKTGGTAVSIFFEKHYSKYIEGRYHIKKCADGENPIIIFREPYDRFNSMFRYWKFGSNRYTLSKEKMNERSQYDINDFAGFIKNNKTEKLYGKPLWYRHFKPQSHWYNCDYSKIIVILYCNDLQNCLNKLFSFINIESKNVKLGVINKTLREVTDYKFNDETTEWFLKYFEEDLNIFSQIKENSHNFRTLIKCD